MEYHLAGEVARESMWRGDGINDCRFYCLLLLLFVSLSDTIFMVCLRSGREADRASITAVIKRRHTFSDLFFLPPNPPLHCSVAK